MVYSVEYFNPIGNCDNVVHVEADNELDAALIAHTNAWTSQKEFDFSDYHVCEFDQDYIIKKFGSHWTDKQIADAREKAIRDYIKEDWKYYKRDGYKSDFYNICKIELGLEEEQTRKIIAEIEG